MQLNFILKTKLSDFHHNWSYVTDTSLLSLSNNFHGKKIHIIMIGLFPGRREFAPIFSRKLKRWLVDRRPSSVSWALQHYKWCFCVPWPCALIHGQCCAHVLRVDFRSHCMTAVTMDRAEFCQICGLPLPEVLNWLDSIEYWEDYRTSVEAVKPNQYLHEHFLAWLCVNFKKKFKMAKSQDNDNISLVCPTEMAFPLRSIRY